MQVFRWLLIIAGLLSLFAFAGIASAQTAPPMGAPPNADLPANTVVVQSDGGVARLQAQRFS